MNLVQLDDYVKSGALQLITELGAPWDLAPVKRLIEWRDAQQ
jgi:hypothetical protein